MHGLPEVGDGTGVPDHRGGVRQLTRVGSRAPAPWFSTPAGRPPATTLHSPIRVAHFTDTWTPRRDGVVTALQTLADAMDDLGHQSLVVVPRQHGQHADDRLMRVPSLPSGVAQFRLAAWPRSRHVERIARWRPTVIHVHTPGPVGLLGIFAARRLGLPLVLTYHTDLFAYADAYRLQPQFLAALVHCYARRLGLPAPHPDHSWSPRAYRRSVVEAGTRLLYGTADTVVVPTDAVFRRSDAVLDFPRPRIVPTGVARTQPRPGARRHFRDTYGIGHDEPVILFVGRLNREKGIDVLAEAFSRLLRDSPRARLVLAGSVPDGRWVHRLLRRHGIEEPTVRTGQLAPVDVADAYAAADMFAFPSRTDTQGLVVAEAALAGLPIVLADPALHRSGPLAGVGLIAGPEPAGFAGALARLLDDRDLARSIGEAGRAKANANTPRAYAKTMANIYTELPARRTDRGTAVAA